MKRLLFPLVAVWSVGMLAGCSGASSGGTAVATPVVAGNCAAVPLAGLAYPLSGSTNISPNVGQLVVSISLPGVGPYQVVQLTSLTGQTLLIGATLGPAPQPLPSPIGALPGTVYQGAAIPTLSSATTYQVRLFGAGLASCAQYVSVGTFTTQ